MSKCRDTIANASTDAEKRLGARNINLYIVIRHFLRF